MEIEEKISFKKELKYILNNSLNNEVKEKRTTYEEKSSRIIADECTSKNINFHRKCVELGLEANDSSPSTPQSKKYDFDDNSDFSESDNEKISVSENYASLSSSAEDSSDNVSDMEGIDDALLQNMRSEIFRKNAEVKENFADKSDSKQQSHNQNFHKKRSLKRKRNTSEENESLEESNSNNPNSDIICPSEKYMKTDTENAVSLYVKQEFEIPEQTFINYTPDMEKLVQNPVDTHNLHKSSLNNLNYKSLSSTLSSNIVDHFSKTFTKQLSGLNLENLMPLQGSQLRAVLESKKNNCASTSNNTVQGNGTPRSSSTATPNRLSIDTDDMLPIQAEVVMSEGSDSEQINETQFQNVNEAVEDYINSFIDCPANGSIIEYPPLSNEVPTDCSDLSLWQLEQVSLPPFRPFVPPPSWLRFTIPPEGYKCESCLDTFFIESSLVQHRERRSVWITIECGPCDAQLTFYNKCAFKSHIQNHMAKGERVEEERVDVKVLPLQLTKLLQPIIVPVPQTLRTMKTPTKGSSCKIPKKGNASSVGKENLPNASPAATLAVSPSSDTGKICSDSSEHIPSTPPSSSKRNVRCYLCDRMFGSVRELMSHMRTNQSHSDQRVECRKCLLVLPSVCAAKAHILTHPPANTSNISVCPECGSRCDGPRDFVHHLNTCGHQYRRSGIKCQQCQVCFYKFSEDFVNHWIKEHCTRSYECVVCRNTFQSLAFHKCVSPGKQVLATFKCLLACPICPYVVQVHTQEERETLDKIRVHLSETHPSMINRVHYVYKSKFCTNAFRSKDELRAHHDREHRRDNHYRTKTCTLHHEVLGHQQQYFNGQEPRNAFITLDVPLSPEEIEEAQTRDVPTVSSVIDKTLYPGGPMTLVSLKAFKEREKIKEVENPVENETKDLTLFDREHLETLRPCVCYRCGYTYTGSKDVRRHKKGCGGESTCRVCQVCGVAAVGEEFSAHCITHISEGLILCMYCNGAPFASTNMLHHHFELHVHEQFCYPAQCAFCPFIMPDVGKALSHLQEEHDPLSSPAVREEVNLECDRCGKTFQGERGLNIHLTRCTASGIQHAAAATPAGTNAVKQCRVCKKGLASEMYGKHMIGHLEEGLLVCSLCDGLTLPSSMSLLYHLKEHSCSLQFPFLCPLCSYTMSNANEALLHLKEDHGFGNLSCANCEMQYTFTYQMQRHVDIVHKVCLYAKRRYICWICRAYDHVKKGTLMNHFRMVHGLSAEEVDEKVMIRTRGQGTMPTSQFIPTKPLGSKETEFDNDLEPKTKNKKRLTLPVLHPKSQVNPTRNTLKSISNGPKNMDMENIVIKQELLDVFQETESSSLEMPPNSNVNGFDLEKVKTERNFTPVKIQNSCRSFKESEDSEMSSFKDLQSSIHKDPQSYSLKATQDSTLKAKNSSLINKQNSSLKDEQILHKNGQVSRLLRDQTRKLVKEPHVISQIKGEHELLKDPSATNIPEKPTCKRPPPKLSIKIGKKFIPRNRDLKLGRGTKVVVKRLPEAVLLNNSSSKNISKAGPKAGPKDPVQKDKANKCNHCNYSTNSKTKLKSHESKHDDYGAEGFLCNVCGQTFVVEPSLKRHLFFAHKIKQKAPALPPSQQKAPAHPPSQQKAPALPPSQQKAPALPPRQQKAPAHPPSQQKAPAHPPNQPIKQEYTIEVSGAKRHPAKRFKRKVAASNRRTRPTRAESKCRPKITIKIKTSPSKKQEPLEGKKITSIKNEITSDGEKGKTCDGKTAEVEDENVSDMQCCVCKEVFESSVKLYSHLRTHGMAFLKLGRKKRTFVQERTSIIC